MDKLVELLHEILDMLPWRQESDKLAAHDKADSVAEAVQAPQGRNQTAPGVVTGGGNGGTEDGGNADANKSAEVTN